MGYVIRNGTTIPVRTVHRGWKICKEESLKTTNAKAKFYHEDINGFLKLVCIFRKGERVQY